MNITMTLMYMLIMLMMIYFAGMHKCNILPLHFQNVYLHMPLLHFRTWMNQLSYQGVILSNNNWIQIKLWVSNVLWYSPPNEQSSNIHRVYKVKVHKTINPEKVSKFIPDCSKSHQMVIQDFTMFTDFQLTTDCREKQTQKNLWGHN